jgi:hypothetical protein
VVYVVAYKASIPRKPSAAPTPAPSAAPGYDAALAVATAGAELLADSVGVCTPDRVVELRPTEDGLIVPADDMSIDDEDGIGVGVGVGVGVAETAAGYMTGRRLFTSEGRAWYHAGVLPAWNEDASCAANSDDDASA